MIKALFFNFFIFFFIIIIIYKVVEILPEDKKDYTKAIAVIEPHNGYKDFKNIKGVVKFEELPSGNTKISGIITGFPKKMSGNHHGIHIHKTGNLTNGCKSLEGHYNPEDKDHSGRLTTDNWGRPKINFDRHVGDLGNVTIDKDGKIQFEKVDPLVRLKGKNSVIGRSIVLHKNEDDLGLGGHEKSRITGNAGPRIACGVIGFE